MRILKYCISFIFLLSGLLAAHSQENVRTDSVKIQFRSGKTSVDLDLGSNRQVLEAIKNKMQLNADDSVYYRLQKVLVVGGASPEGSISLNERLSEQRAEALFNHLSQYGTFPDSLRHYTFLGRDWKGLLRLAEADPNLPDRDETLGLLLDIVEEAPDMAGKTDAVRRLKSLRGGAPYRYMYREYFPALRASSMFLWYQAVTLPPFSEHTSLKKSPKMDVPRLASPEWVVLEPEPVVAEEWTRQLYVKTNGIALAMAIVNLGVEVDICKHLSFTLPVYFSAWDYFKSTIKFRTFCVQPEFRYWFNEHNEGWFVGAHFGGAFYNYALDGDWRIQDHHRETPSLGGGISAGYRKAISRNKRWKMEFTLGGGVYDSHYDKFYNTPDVKDGLLQGDYKKIWYGLDQAAVSIAYTFDLKKKGGAR